jgi:hypothetical protein
LVDQTDNYLGIQTVAKKVDEWVDLMADVKVAKKVQ